MAPGLGLAHGGRKETNMYSNIGFPCTKGNVDNVIYVARLIRLYNARARTRKRSPTFTPKATSTPMYISKSTPTQTRTQIRTHR